MLVGTAMTGQSTSPPTTLGKAPSIPATTTMASAWLIDLVGVTRQRKLHEARRLQNLMRLHASFRNNVMLTRTDKLRFLRTYLQWGLLGRQSWKQWWRALEKATQAKAERNARHGRPLA